MNDVIQAIRHDTHPWIRIMALGAAMVLTELLFKFGSFTLECVGFLALWYVLDVGATRGLGDPD